MSNFTLSLFSVFCYVGAGLGYYRTLTKTSPKNSMSFALTSIALLTHALLLYHWIDVNGVQNLNFFNIFSLVAWLVALLVFIGNLYMPLRSLFIFVLPFTALTELAVLFFPSVNLVETSRNTGQLVHILTSLLAISLLGVAGFQAGLCQWQNNILKTKPSSRILQLMPPLEYMERLMFQMLWVGFLFLTFVLWASVYLFYDSLSWASVSKTILSIGSWGMFGVLLFGRAFYGWRGRFAARWILLAVMLLLAVMVVTTL